MKSRIFLAVAVLLVYASVLVADEGHHPDELSQAQLGKVHFPSSCQPEVAKSIEQGVAMLHSFWYEEAEKKFEQIEKDDPRCAVAHWGVAMSLWHQLWNRPDREALTRGRSQLDHARNLDATPRERGYLSALSAFYGSRRAGYDKRVAAYSKAMERLSETNPDDHEAAAFYALSLLAAEPDNDKTNANRKKAAAVLERLFAREPEHPGVAHYLIHAYDTPEMAEQGLAAARRYAQIAPAAPHALHMPSHIFARLGLWPEDIASNVSSIQATRQEAAMHMGGVGHQFHAMDFLVYAYLQTGREQDAEKLIAEVEAMPPVADMYGIGSDARLFALTAFRAGYELELHHSDQAARMSVVPGAPPAIQAITYIARIIGASQSQELDSARKDMGELQRIVADLKKKDKQSSRQINEEMAVAAPWLEYAQGRKEAAVRSLRALAEKEPGISEISQLPSPREMLADMLLAMNRPGDALEQYGAELKTNPGRFNSLYGAAQAAVRAGRPEEAKPYYAQLLKNCEGSTSQREELRRARAALELSPGQASQASF